ncbi:MAG: ATP-grasp domain-containing protein [Bacillus sp. (in: firmicutes)]
MTILIMNPANDSHSLHLMKRLKERYIDFLELGSLKQNDYSFVNSTLIYNNIPIEPVTSVFYRANFTFTPASPEDTYIDSFNGIRLLESNLETIHSWMTMISQKGGKIINPPAVRSKFLQIHRLLEANIPLPNTCITNSPQVIKAFVKEVGNAVYKPVSGGFFCRRINQEFLDSIDLFIREPAIYQEEIEGEDIRVNLLNKKVLSAHIIERSDEKILDYRTDSLYEEGNTRYIPTELPSHVADFCVKASEILNLTFTGIDLKVNSKGQYYLIECNSMPAYLDIEFKTGTPITDSIIDYLSTDNEKNVHTSAVQFPKNQQIDHDKLSLGRKYLFDYKSVLTHFMETKAQIIKLPLNKTQKQFFSHSGINNPQTMIIKVDQTGCQLIGVE